MDYIENIVYRSLRRSLTFYKLYVGKKCIEITMTMRFNAGIHFCNIYCINGKTYNSLNTNNFPYQTYSIYVWTLFFRPVMIAFYFSFVYLYILPLLPYFTEVRHNLTIPFYFKQKRYMKKIRGRFVFSNEIKIKPSKCIFDAITTMAIILITLA